MHCSNVNHLKKIAPEKTVNRINLVVLDIEYTENKIVKELGVYKDGQTVRYSFLPPEKFKSTSQSCWCTKHLHGISWSSGYEKHTEFEKKIYYKSRSNTNRF